MTPILNLPDEPKYTIKIVAFKTGIRPVTLRAWERRQDILHPYRQSNQYRLYSERDVAILRWLKDRVDGGVPISNAIHELRFLTAQDMWPELIANPLSQAANRSKPVSIGDQSSAGYTKHLYQMLLDQDEKAAKMMLQELKKQYDLALICLEVIDPVQQQIAKARFLDEISAQTWHFAMDILRETLLSFLQNIPTAMRGPLIILGCAPMEFNEISVILLSVLLKTRGYRVEYLGSDMAVKDLAVYAADQLPAAVILSANSVDTALEMAPMQILLKRIHPTPVFAYLTTALDTQSERIKEVPGVYLGSKLEIACNNIIKLVRPRQRNNDPTIADRPVSDFLA